MTTNPLPFDYPLYCSNLDTLDGAEHRIETAIRVEMTKTPRLQPDDNTPAPVLARDVVQSYPTPAPKVRITWGEIAAIVTVAAALIVTVVFL